MGTGLANARTGMERKRRMVKTLARRGLLAATPLALAALAGCAAPPPPPPPPTIVIESLAAYATVRGIDPVSRELTLTTMSGGLFQMTPDRGARLERQLRVGSRVAVEYVPGGQTRLAIPRPGVDPAATGRIRATVSSVAQGGGAITAVGPNGVPQTGVIPDRAMRAFATRLGAGDQIAVTFTTRPTVVAPQ